MSEKILVAYNRSDPAEEAIRYACETFPDSDITALHVINIHGQEEWYVPQAKEDRVQKSEEVLETARALAGDVDITTESMVGMPDHTILDYAEEHDFDLIVIGSHGRSGVARSILGSVAERVVRHSPLPVLVVH